jgi:hypothetical protein
MSAPYSPGHRRILHARGDDYQPRRTLSTEVDDERPLGARRVRVEHGAHGRDRLVGVDVALGRLLIAVELEAGQVERVGVGADREHADPVADRVERGDGATGAPIDGGDVLLSAGERLDRGDGVARRVARRTRRRGPRSPIRTSSAPSTEATPATETFASPSTASWRTPRSAAASAGAASMSFRRPTGGSYG